MSSAAHRSHALRRAAVCAPFKGKGELCCHVEDPGLYTAAGIHCGLGIHPVDQMEGRNASV